MNNRHTRRMATYGLLILLSLFVLLHAAILLGVIPFQMVWGGRLKEHSQMLVFETGSLLFNLLMLAVVAVQAGLLRLKVPPILIRLALWGMFGLFLLNTLGNALSTNQLEKFLFTPVTALLAIFSLRLATSQYAPQGTIR